MIELAVTLPNSLYREFDGVACEKQDNDTLRMRVDLHHDLQERVLDALPANQNVLHVKSQEDFECLLSGDFSAVVTVKDAVSGKLIGQSVPLFPNDHAPDADMVDMDMSAFDPNNISSIGAVVTDPAYRDRHLMLKMLGLWFAVMEDMNRQYAMATITNTNVQSWVTFLKAGLLITGVGFDASDNSHVYYAVRDLKEPFSQRGGFKVKDESLVQTVSPDMPLDNVKKLFNAGYVGFAAQRSPDPAGPKYTNRLLITPRDNILG
ncbi:MAG: hypothetical protein CMH32_00760 [Micavibrio sp.]|nr:hypothetical protein [Micavibrio sp.]HCK33330.1 hypothetical protein [Rhodospirillaceae bacterium]